MVYNDAIRRAVLKYRQKNREKINIMEKERIYKKRLSIIDYTHEIQRFKRIDPTLFL